MFVEAPPKRKKSPLDIFTPKWWQEKGITWFLKKAEAGLFLAPGLGKTAIALFAFFFLRKKNVVNIMLVVSQRRIIYNVWRQEVEKWGLPFDVALVHGQSKDKHGKTKKLRELERDADIYLINFEALAWLLQYPRLLKKFAGGMLVIDESSKVKTWTADRTKALKKLLPLFKRRYILSGSPTPNSMQDIFSQIYILDMGDTLGRYIGDFRNEYFYRIERKIKLKSGAIREWNEWELMEDAEDGIYKKLRKLVLRIPEEVLGLDPYIPIVREVELPAPARKKYNEVEQEFITWLESGNVLTAANAGVATQKLRQIASGAVYYKSVEEVEDDDGQLRYSKKKQYEILHTEKYDELELLINELRGLPALIGYEYDHERIEIQKRLKCPAIYGGTSDKEADELIRAWNAGELPVLLGYPGSISHGLNLQDTYANIIFFTCGYNLDNHEQFIRRVWRQGQKGTVTVYYINSVNTLDDVVQGVLTLKDSNQQRLLRALETRQVPTQKGDDMPTNKASKKKASKKAPAKKKRVQKKAAKKTARKKAPAKRKAAKKTNAKKTTRKTGRKPTPKKARTDGLRAGTVQAAFVDLCRRKTGVKMADAVDRLKSSEGSVRVMVNLLKGKGFAIKRVGGAYKLAK